MTDLINVSLPAWERSLDCQARMQVCIFSNKGWKARDDFHLVRRGMPKYFPRSWTIGMFVREEMLRWVSEEVFREKNILDLDTLQICPDASLKCEKGLKRVMQS